MSDLKEKWKIFNFVILKLCLSHIGYKCYLSWNSSLELLDLLGFESSSLMCCQIMWNPYFHPQFLHNPSFVRVFTGFSQNCDSVHRIFTQLWEYLFTGFSHKCESVHRIFTQLWEHSQDFHTIVRVFTGFLHNCESLHKIFTQPDSEKNLCPLSRTAWTRLWIPKWVV